MIQTGLMKSGNRRERGMDIKMITQLVKTKLGKHYTVGNKEVIKNNGMVKHGLEVRKDGEQLGVMVYLDDFHNLADTEIAERVVEIICNSELPAYDCGELACIFRDKTELLNHAVCQLVNHSENEEFLKKVPHRDFLDLAVVYRIKLNMEDSCIGSVLVTNEHISVLSITATELDEAANRNTRAKGFLTRSIADVIGKSCMDDFPMYVITNAEAHMGAYALCDEEGFSKLAHAVGDDLIVIPSSVHEIIAVPANAGFDVNGIRSVVGSVNSDIVSDDERLSGNVYRYSRSTGKIQIAE